MFTIAPQPRCGWKNNTIDYIFVEPQMGFNINFNRICLAETVDNSK